MMSQTGKRHQSSRGFTLIELILVAAIIMVLIAVSTPAFRGTFSDIRLEDAAHNISKIIQYGQQRAIIEEKSYRLQLDFDRMAYYLLVEEAAEFERVKGRFGSYFYLPEGVTLKADSDKITFSPDGRCESVVIYITDEKNKSFSVKVTGRAGRTEVRRAAAE